MTQSPIAATALEVKRENFRETRVVADTIDAQAAIAAGKTVLAIDRFALTANNITYAAFGTEMSYWNFFPADDGYGRIPVWGFADVVATATPGLAVRDRVYGYFPMASHLVVEAGKVSPKRFIDMSPHRAKLPPVYNSYERVAADPGDGPKFEPHQMLLRPLVVTSFLIADFLADNAMFGASQVLISSASSKTSLGLAHCLKALAPAGTTVTGLTSPANTTFVTNTGLYDRVVAYDAITALDASVPSVYVDMAGSAPVLSAVHTHFAERITHSCRVGGTHWESLARRMELPGARPTFFFAPSQIQKRLADWGPGGLESRFGAQWAPLLKAFAPWLKFEDHRGAAAVQAAYAETLAGKTRPESGLILSLKG